jgi:hypothetical protein
MTRFEKLSTDKDLRFGFFVTIGTALCYGLYPSTSKIAYADGANPSFLIIVSTFIRVAILNLWARSRGYSLADMYRGSLSSLPSGFLQAISIYC